MKRVVLNMQNCLLSDAVKRALHSDGEFMVEVARHPEDTAAKCVSYMVNTVIMEVTGYSPWRLCERMRIRDELRKICPDCKIVLLVDENSEREVAEQVKTAKSDR